MKQEPDQEIKEKLMLVGMALTTLILAGAAGAGSYAPLAAMFSTSALAAFFVLRFQKKRRAVDAAGTVEGEQT